MQMTFIINRDKQLLFELELVRVVLIFLSLRPMEVQAAENVQVDSGESNEKFIRVTNHGKMRLWIACSLSFFEVSLIFQTSCMYGVAHLRRVPMERNALSCIPYLL